MNCGRLDARRWRALSGLLEDDDVFKLSLDAASLTGYARLS
jgi:hypothetical protein